MAVKKSLNTKTTKLETKPKITRQGKSVNTKYSATSRNKAGKRYRGQG